MQAVSVSNLTYSYGNHKAVDGISFSVHPGTTFALVGPNGGGKSTTFKILSTLLHVQQGEASVFGFDLKDASIRARQKLGVVFQSPALDKKLTVEENLYHHGHLYGLSGEKLKSKARELLARFDVLDRKLERVEKLSGGLQRRVEIAKALLPEPKLLILDEPSTGLDPLARLEMWRYLKKLQKEFGLTILFTTHLLEEAEYCDHVAMLNKGKLVAFGSPEILKGEIQGEVLTVKSKDPMALKAQLEAKWGHEVTALDREIRIQKSNAHELIPNLVAEFKDSIDSMTVGRPTLEDLFIQKTGEKYGHEVQQ